MGFHEVRFPTDLSFGSVGGPERRTEVVTLVNGFEERNTAWAHSRRRYDAGMGLRSLDDVEVLIAFFEARRGQLYGFRWKDWADFKSSAASKPVDHMDQILGTGDGSQTEFALMKTYRSGGQSYVRPIRKPVPGTVQVALAGDRLIEGPDYSVQEATGRVLFSVPPDPGVEVTCGFEFDVPVRFDTDRIQTSVATFRAGDVPSVPVVEVRI
ncbi:MAG: TIGR02217 family protein [Pseudorhodobacter sp.]